MVSEKFIDFIKKKGVSDTFNVLTKFKNFKTDKKTFYKELNEFSYYNSYFRVKEDLVNNGIITIKKNGSNGKKFIELTKKGQTIYKKLEDVNNLINS